MKVCFAVVALICAMIMGCGGKKVENSYSIKGNVGDEVKAQWVYMKDFATGVSLDSARIEKGDFVFAGVADTMRLVYFQPGADGEYPAVGWIAVLEKGQMTMTTDNEYVAGTPLNEGLKDWMTQVGQLLQNNGNPKLFFDAHWQEHGGDIVGSVVLSQVFPMLPFRYVDSLMQTVPAEVRTLPYVAQFVGQLEAMRRLQPGEPYIDAALTTLKGEPVKLSDYIGHGDYVLVDFWASWCGPCRQAMPEVQEVVKKYKKLKVLGIAVSDKVADTELAMKNLNINWPVVSSLDASVAQSYGIYGIPAMILFDPDGTIVARDLHASSLDQVLVGVGI